MSVSQEPTATPVPGPPTPDEAPPRPGAEALAGVVTGGVLMLLSVGYLVETTRITIAATSSAGMNARTYPYLLGALMLTLSLILLVGSGLRLRVARPWRRGGGTTGQREAHGLLANATTRQVAKTAAACLVSAAYLTVLPGVGFLISTPPLVATLIMLCDNGHRYLGRRVWVPIVTGVGLTVAAHALFVGALGVLLPAGLLDLEWPF